MEIRLEGTEELKRALQNMTTEIREQVEDAVLDTAAELEGAIKLRVQQGPKTGKLYKRRSVVHQASAPGESPASDTGDLMRSIYHEQIAPLTATVGSRLAYALYLEYGTRRGLEQRPFFRPAVEAIRPKFYKALERAVAGAIK